MKLKSSEVEVIEGAPFANDLLKRKESAEALTQFVLSANEPLVICIDAPWGQGKTTFLKMWERHLKDNAIPTLYFNAWESDFSDDALVCLIGEIGAAIDELSRSGNASKAREYLNRAKELGASLLKRGLPVAAKLATAGVLDFDKATEQALAGLAESLAKEQLERYEISKKALGAFRETLAGFANSITDDAAPKPLVFIIDELDRCRPNFAIELLEKAKHFFNVENIVFVLGADKEQLGSSIKAIYGDGLNVNGYLRRFIDFDYILPPPEKGNFVKALFRKFLFNQYFSQKTSADTRYEGEQALTMFAELFELFRLTLREQEHCCALLSVSIRTTGKEHRLYPLFLCLLIVLKVKTADVYKNYVTGHISPAQLVKYLDFDVGAGELLATNYGAVLEAHIMTSKSPHHGFEEELKGYHSILASSSSSDVEKQRAQRILDISNNFGWNGGAGLFGYLINKIEVASRFKS